MTKEEIIEIFNDYLRVNPYDFDNEEYLAQIKLEIIKLEKKENSDFWRLDYRLRGFNYENCYENGGSTADGPGVFAKAIYHKVVFDSDLARKDKKVAALIDLAEKEADDNLKKQEEELRKKERWDFLKFWKKRPVKWGRRGHLGYCNSIWREQKRILKEKYNIDWKTPHERNPDVKFD